jgi:hypothetical protein
MTAREVIARWVSHYAREYFGEQSGGKTEADSILSALEQAGYVVVPIEPTVEMWDAAENASMAFSVSLDNNASKEDTAKEIAIMTRGLVKNFDPFNYPTGRIANLVLGYITMLAAAKPSSPAQSETE